MLVSRLKLEAFAKQEEDRGNVRFMNAFRVKP